MYDNMSTPRDDAFYLYPLADERDGPVSYFDLKKQYPDVPGFNVSDGKWYAARHGIVVAATQEEIDEENRYWEEHPEKLADEAKWDWDW